MTGAGDDVALVRRLFEAGPEVQALLLAGEDLADHPWLSLWHPECVLEELADVPDAATYHGREGVVRFLQTALRDVWEEWRFEPHEIIQGTDGVFAAVTNSGRSKTGIDVQLAIFQIFRIRDGMIAYVTGFMDREEAARAVGLAR